MKKLKIILTDGSTVITEMPDVLKTYIRPNADLKSLELIEDEPKYNVFAKSLFKIEIPLAEDITELDLRKWLSSLLATGEIIIRKI
jgi:hypothetical protein